MMGDMDNCTWYSDVIRFCRQNDTCQHCPYHLVNDTKIDGTLPCFSSKENLALLSDWLGQPHQGQSVPGEEIESMMDEIVQEDDEDYLMHDLDHA
jgi:hypothetical protein